MLPPPGQLAQSLFPDLDLGDVRRDRRFAQVVDALVSRTGGSLPALFPHPADYDACLRLFDAPTATHERILAAHPVAVLDRLESVTTPVLLIHDATHLDFSGHATLRLAGWVHEGSPRPPPPWLADHLAGVAPVPNHPSIRTVKAKDVTDCQP